MTYTAQFSSTRNEYTIRFNTDGGNTILQSLNLMVIQLAPADQLRPDTFAGWDQAILQLCQLKIITASWTINQYTITLY